MPIWPSSRGSTLADVDSPDARKYDSAINLDDLALYQNRFSVRMQSGERALENAPRGSRIDHGGYVNIEARKSDRDEDSCLVKSPGRGIGKSRSADREFRWEHRVSRPSPIWERDG